MLVCLSTLFSANLEGKLVILKHFVPNVGFATKATLARRAELLGCTWEQVLAPHVESTLDCDSVLSPGLCSLCSFLGRHPRVYQQVIDLEDDSWRELQQFAQLLHLLEAQLSFFDLLRCFDIRWQGEKGLRVVFLFA